jgi:hypothetical protein
MLNFCLWASRLKFEIEFERKYMVVEAVLCRPVSAEFSQNTGKKSGKSGKKSRFYRLGPVLLGNTSKLAFRTNANIRESTRAYQGTFLE